MVKNIYIIKNGIEQWTSRCISIRIRNKKSVTVITVLGYILEHNKIRKYLI